LWEGVVCFVSLHQYGSWRKFGNKFCLLQVYRGAETKVQLNDIEPGADYNVRVCPVRQTGIGNLPGAYSPPSTFSTLLPDLVTTTATRTAVMQVSLTFNVQKGNQCPATP
jgi:hypothetical protein